jgi:DNA-binding transcriptional LysR family regulator
MLDATRLRVLVAVARYGSVTAAAQALNYAQPSISHHIARLEAETGAKLMERAGRGVKLTDAGQLLAQRAEEILGRLDAAEAELATHVRLRQDRVRVAAFGSALGTLVAAAAQALRGDHGHCGVHVIHAGPATAMHLLNAGDVDVAITFRYLCDGTEPAALLPAAKDRQGSESPDGQLLLDEPVHLITTFEYSNNPLGQFVPAQAEPPGQAQLRASILARYRDQHWVATGEQCEDLAHDLCHGAGFTPEITMRTPDNTAAQALVAAGLGVAILPDLALRAARHPRIRAIELPGVRREIIAVTYPASPDPTAVTRFLAALAQAANENRGPGQPPASPQTSAAPAGASATSAAPATPAAPAGASAETPTEAAAQAPVASDLSLSTALSEAIPVTRIVPYDRFYAIWPVGRRLGELDPPRTQLGVVGMAVGGRHHARAQRALGHERAHLIRGLLVQHRVGRIHQHEFLTRAPRRPHRQPAHPVIHGDVIRSFEAKLFGVELLGRILVKHPDRHDRNPSNHQPPP